MTSRTLLAFALISTAIGATSAQVPGTYRLTICATPCTDSDSGVVRGSLTLLRDSVRFDTISPGGRLPFLMTSSRLIGSLYAANACFTLRREERHIKGRELYAGIIDHSATFWRSDGTTISVLLYLSPDGAYTLSGRSDGSTFSGKGSQRTCCGGTSPETFFRAIRIGDPDPEACLS